MKPLETRFELEQEYRRVSVGAECDDAKAKIIAECLYNGWYAPEPVYAPPPIAQEPPKPVLTQEEKDRAELAQAEFYLKTNSSQEPSYPWIEGRAEELRQKLNKGE